MVTRRAISADTTIERIRRREAVVGVIGLGYVGLPLAVAAAEAGYPVLGLDRDRTRTRQVNVGRSPVGDIDDGRLHDVVLDGGRHTSALRPGLLLASSDLRRVRSADVVVVCVPTPLTRAKDPDLSHVEAAIDAAVAGWHPGMAVILESTSFPGTTEEVVLPRLRAAGPGGLEAGEDFFLAFSPERIDPGRRDWTLRSTPKVVGGVTPRCLEVAREFYSSIVDRVIPVSRPAAAEMVKILENTYRSVNVALANEMAVICHEMGIDVWEVIGAAGTKPFGFTPFYPGPGLGGHCIPIDPLYLAWRLRMLKLPARSIQLADELNSAMPAYVVSRIEEVLDRRGVSLAGSRILLLGATYKADVGDVRESPSIEVFEKLQRRGSIVSYHDPFVPRLDVGGVVRERTELSPGVIEGFDCVVILTAHSHYDWPAIVSAARLVFDTRNAAAGVDRSLGEVVTL